MPSRLEERDWDILLRRIRDGKCTPFLGAGVNAGVLPLGSDIARQWAAQYKYPLEDGTDLARVAQFLAVSSRDKMFPKEEIVKSFEGVAPPDFSAHDDPQGALADLPLPVYMSTNYDDFMVLPGPPGLVAAAISPDGRTIVTGREEGLVQIYACDLCQSRAGLLSLARSRLTRSCASR